MPRRGKGEVGDLWNLQSLTRSEKGLRRESDGGPNASLEGRTARGRRDKDHESKDGLKPT